VRARRARGWARRRCRRARARWSGQGLVALGNRRWAHHLSVSAPLEDAPTMPSPHDPTDPSATVGDDHADDIVYPAAVPFLLVHLACFAALWTGVTAEALVLGAALYVLRIFAIGAGYHRYFAHRAYKTSRAFQFLLGFLAQTSAQRGRSEERRV